MKNLTTMEITTLIISASALFVSILAMSGSLYTYLVHNAKLKKQEDEIQKYQIKKNIEEELLKKQAHLNIEKEPISNLSFTIKITNDGLCDARDLRIKIDDNANFSIIKNPFPIKLLGTKDHETLELLQLYATSTKLMLNFTWEDDNKQDNKCYKEISF